MAREILTLLLLALTLIAGIGIYPNIAFADEATADDGEADEIIVGDTDEDGEMPDTEEPEELSDE